MRKIKKNKVICQCCDRQIDTRDRCKKEGQYWTGHPLRKGEFGLSGLIALYTRSGELRGFTSEYRNLDGERVRKYFSIAENKSLENTIRLAEIHRLQGLDEYHAECIEVINTAIKERPLPV